MNTVTAPHILIIDDDTSVRDMVVEYLGKNDMRVSAGASGREMFEVIDREAIDLVLLDLKLPGEDGMQLARTLRERATVPIVLLTGRNEEADRVMGLELGADDYVTKPFSPRELILRVRAVLRRRVQGGDAGERPLEHGPLRLEPGTHRCLVGGREISVTAREFQLLAALMRRPGRVMTRDRLLDEVWGRDITVTSRTIDTHLKRLREKLNEAGTLIETVRGVGYRFAE